MLLSLTQVHALVAGALVLSKPAWFQLCELWRFIFPDDDKISSEILAQRMYFVYSILNGLLGKQGIMQELFYVRKSFSNQGSSIPITILENSIPAERDHLFAILDNLPIKKGQEVLEKMIYLSEKDYVKILGEQGKTPSDLRDKMMADYARIQSPNRWNAEAFANLYSQHNADQPKRLIVDNFWDGWPDEQIMQN